MEMVLSFTLARTLGLENGFCQFTLARARAAYIKPVRHSSNDK